MAGCATTVLDCSLAGCEMADFPTVNCALAGCATTMAGLGMASCGIAGWTMFNCAVV